MESMPDTRYHIIFSALIEDRPPAEVHHDLADLFSIDEERVRKIFARQGVIVKSNLDRVSAEKYVQIILAAGAICLIEPMPTNSSDVSAEESPAIAAKDIPQPGPPLNMKYDAETCSSDANHTEQQSPQSRMENADRETPAFSTPALAALLLLASAALPLISHAGELHWPWSFVFELAPTGLLWWAVLPIAAAGILALLRAPAFSLIVVFVGILTLLSCTVVFWEAALVVPLRFLPLDRTVALAYVLPLLGAAVCNAACSAIGELGELIMLRLLAACGSLAIFIPVCLCLFTAGEVWGRWPLILLLLLLLLYAILVFACSCLPSVPEFFLHQVRLLGIFLICWAPVAAFLAHVPLTEPDTGKALFMAILKTGLLYYGALAAISGGLRTEFLYRFEK